MSHMRMRFHHSLANFPDIRGLEHLSYARIAFSKPFVQACLSAPDDRMNCPKRVIQVERYGADAIHEIQLPARLQ